MEAKMKITKMRNKSEDKNQGLEIFQHSEQQLISLWV